MQRLKYRTFVVRLWLEPSRSADLKFRIRIGIEAVHKEHDDAGQRYFTDFGQLVQFLEQEINAISEQEL